MNKLYIFFLTIAVLMFSFGCDNYDDRYTEEYASVVRLSEFGEKIVSVSASQPLAVYEISLLRSGHDINRETIASFRAMSDGEWTKYANTYGLQRYYRVPDDCIWIGETPGTLQVDVDFVSGMTAADISVTVDSERLQAYSASLPPPELAGDEWANVICLPLTLDVVNGSVLEGSSDLVLRLVYDRSN